MCWIRAYVCVCVRIMRAYVCVCVCTYTCVHTYTWMGWCIMRETSKTFCQKISDKNVFANWDENTCAYVGTRVRTCMLVRIMRVRLCIRVCAYVCRYVYECLCVREAKLQRYGMDGSRESSRNIFVRKYLTKMFLQTGTRIRVRVCVRVCIMRVRVYVYVYTYLYVCLYVYAYERQSLLD